MSEDIEVIKLGEESSGGETKEPREVTKEEVKKIAEANYDVEVGDKDESKENEPVITGDNRKEPENKGQFVKGDPRINRNGAPRGKTLIPMLREALDKIPLDKYGKKLGVKKYKELLIQAILTKAIIKGDVSMMREILDRIDGKVKDELDLNVKDINIPDEDVDKVIEIWKNRK